MKRRILIGSIVACVVGLVAGFVAQSGHTELICHITPAEVEDGRCLAVVVEVSSQGAAAHTLHGDPPAPAGASAGDRLLVGCP